MSETVCYIHTYYFNIGIMDKPSLSPCNCPSEWDICPGIHIFILVGKILKWVFPLTRVSQFSPPCLVVQELNNRMPSMLQNSFYSDVHADCLECPSLRSDIISSSLHFYGSLKKHWRKEFGHEHIKAKVYQWVRTLSMYFLSVGVNHLICNWDRCCSNWPGGYAEKWRVCL